MSLEKFGMVWNRPQFEEWERETIEEKEAKTNKINVQKELLSGIRKVGIAVCAAGNKFAKQAIEDCAKQEEAQAIKKYSDSIAKQAKQQEIKGSEFRTTEAYVERKLGDVMHEN